MISAKIKGYGYYKPIFYFFLSLTLFIFLILCPQSSKEGIKEGISLCVKFLVPSTFMFMVTSSLIVKSKAIDVFSKLTESLGKILLRMDGKCFTVLLLCLIGGYPIGAVMIAGLKEKNEISAENAEKLSYICVGAGIGFVINFTGTEMLGSTKAGIIIYISQIISVILLGYLNKFIKYGKNNEFSIKENKSPKKITGNTPSPFFESVRESSENTINMCSIVITFSVINEAIKHLIRNNDFLTSGANIALEVTNSISSLSGKVPIEIIAFSIGFGGISVAMQIFMILNKINFSKIVFILHRLLCGTLCGIITHIGLIIFPIEKDVFSTIEVTPSPLLATGTLGGITLILCMIFYIMSFKESRR